MVMSRKNKIEMIKISSSKERKESIANGTWIMRGTVFDDTRKKERSDPKYGKIGFEE